MTEQRRTEDILRLVFEATAPVTGDEFFHTLMRKLATALDVCSVFITECIDYPTTRVQMLAYWVGEDFKENMEYELADKPCEKVIKESKICYYPKVGKSFPTDKIMVGMEGYIGIPIFEVSGNKVIGHIAIADDKEISDELVIESVFRIFAIRVAAELQRKQAVDALKDSEEKYRLIVENQTDLVVKLDTKGNVLFANPACCTTLGKSEADLLGKPFLPLVDEKDHEATIQTWTGVFRPPYTSYTQRWMNTASGSRWFAWSATAVFDNTQNIREVVAVGRDVTDERRAQEVLRLVVEATSLVTGDEFFRALMRKIATTLGVRWAFVTECLDYPTTRVRIIAYWSGEDFAATRDFELAGTSCEHVIKDGKIVFYPKDVSKYFPIEKKFGRESTIGIPIFEATGRKVIGHIAIFDDKEMTDEILIESVFKIFATRAGAELQRVQSERALRDSEEKYRLIVENQTDLVVKLDTEGQLLFASPSYCSMFGKTKEELLGTSFPPLHHESGQSSVTETWATLFKPPYRCQVEQRTMTAHGWRWIAWAAKAVLDEAQNTLKVVAVGRDITEQKRAEEQARQHVNELAHVSRLSSMGEMASALAHELNQPLASILSYSQACLRLSKAQTGNLTELRAALERVAKNAERAGDIIRHTRDFVRKEEPQRTPVSANYLVREVYRLARPEARQSDISLTLNLAEDLEPIEVDNIQIQQVIFNLLRNGMEAIDAGFGDKRSVSIRTSRTSDDTVEIAISDTGIGVSPEIGERLFEPFVTTKTNGMGIGLSISRSIIEAHGGRLSATPNPDKGTTFHISLPSTSESDVVVA